MFKQAAITSVILMGMAVPSIAQDSGRNRVDLARQVLRGGQPATQPARTVRGPVRAQPNRGHRAPDRQVGNRGNRGIRGNRGNRGNGRGNRGHGRTPVIQPIPVRNGIRRGIDLRRRGDRVHVAPRRGVIERGYRWETRRVWVPESIRRVWVPARYERRWSPLQCCWVTVCVEAGFYREVCEPGYWDYQRVRVRCGGPHYGY